VKPKIYSIDEHRLPHERIDNHAYYVVMKLRKHGHQAYLVGGSVRDLLLNCRPKDYDISTSATPEEVKKCFRNCLLIGRRFRLAHVRFGKKIIEVATFRAGETENTDLIVRDNVWGTEEEDVIRRDFTINGLFYDPENHTIIDYVNGFEDLEKKVIRTIGDPSTRFKQDPVRMIRLLKFYARFDLDIDQKTYDALIQCKGEIVKSSPTRILEELLRMLESGHAKDFFRHLQEQGFLELMTPLLSRYLEKENALYYELLEHIDIFHKKDLKHKYNRGLLLASLIFPLVHERLLNEDKGLHLGQINQIINSTIFEVFTPFFHIPKKLRAIMVSVLANQYRFTPLAEKKRKSYKIPRDPFFCFSLDFFKLRADTNPSFLKTYTKWHEILFKSHKKTKKVAKTK